MSETKPTPTAEQKSMTPSGPGRTPAPAAPDTVTRTAKSNGITITRRDRKFSTPPEPQADFARRKAEATVSEVKGPSGLKIKKTDYKPTEPKKPSSNKKGENN